LGQFELWRGKAGVAMRPPLTGLLVPVNLAVGNFYHDANGSRSEAGLNKPMQEAACERALALVGKAITACHNLDKPI